jgi:transcriptional regulator with XRE-family HTH domain
VSVDAAPGSFLQQVALDQSARYRFRRTVTGSETPQKGAVPVVIFRRLLGEVLRAQRMRRGFTLRQVSADARVSLGYISEIERGQKEASSELLASICAALDVPLSEILSDVSDAVALEEAALAMQLESLRSPLDTTSIRGPEGGSGSRSGDVVASAA